MKCHDKLRIAGDKDFLGGESQICEVKMSFLKSRLRGKFKPTIARNRNKWWSPFITIPVAIYLFKKKSYGGNELQCYTEVRRLE